MSDLIGVTRVGPAAVVTLQRPEALNAVTLSMIRELEQVVRDAVADPDVFGVVVTGAGRGFCAGLDATALTAIADTGSSARDVLTPGELPGLFSFLLEQPKPIIAAVNGVTAGGGFVLALKCDLRFASSAASFVTVFSKRGLIAEHGTTWLLPRLVGTGNALDLLWSSRTVDATEALRIGLVERVVEPDHLLSEAVGYLGGLAEQVSAASVADTKRLVYRHAAMEIAAAFTDVDEVGWAAIDRPDATEGAAAWVERRPPKFPPLGRSS